jgi:hypothetical protein
VSSGPIWKLVTLEMTKAKFSALVQDLKILYSSRHSEDVRPLLKDIFEKQQNETQRWKYGKL